MPGELPSIIITFMRHHGSERVILPRKSRTTRSLHPEIGATPGGQRQADTSRPDGRGRLAWFMAIVLIVSGVLSFGTRPAYAQQKRSKVPVIGKLSSAGSAQAFSGKLESLDQEHNLLKVNTVQGNHTEIFQVKKGVSVYTAGGDKLKLKELTPGTDVLVYFELKDERRTVKEIVVLANAPAEEKKSPPPS